ncbi:mucin-5AC-like isoform X1 [Cyprinodon tularosa]|uniref:mucin-5AC-like isoform X1 n=1 Tax=Cyprinodon tularosa TaxID=77115 RepID=UPI0018E1FFB9|nr:mucin-5AC-like isoform X1 [Cyprinodon tularosa]
MELPLGGPALRHYTQSRPRPHRQKLNYRPSRPQETIIESENEVLEHMGRVDEGVEEFFTKKVLPTDTLIKQDEEVITQQEVAPASSVPACPPPSKTLRRKLGDFFTLKRKRGLKSEPSQEGRPKKASIADFIRPLREVARSEKDKEKERVKEHDKENEKEKAKANPSAVTGEEAVQETPVTGDAPMRGEAAPPRRALREGKSQSLILLSGSAAAGATNARNTAKKQFEGQHSFEQKLHLMLQRIGVSKPPPGETQTQEGEMKKAESEGTIIDNKPEPPSTFSKPRTMSASSDTRHQIRVSVSAHEAAGKPALLPKPAVKPALPLATSGRNTPENELAQIQEAEMNTPTKPSMTAAPSTPATPDLSATTSPSSVPTLSDPAPDAASVAVSSSTTETEICTHSVKPAAATTTSSTSSTVSDGVTSVPKSSAPDPETPIPTNTSIFTPTELPGTVSVIPNSSESVTPTLFIPSTSETVTTSSIPTLETGSAALQQSSVTKTSTDVPTEAASLEPKVALSAAECDISVTTATPPSHTTTSNSGLHTPSSTSATACHSPNLGTVTAAPITPPSPVPSVSLPPTADDTLSPTSSDHMDSASSPAKVQSAAHVCAPSTSSSDTNPTDTASTATSSTRVDTTSTSSSAGTAAISSPHITGSDPVSMIPTDEETDAPPHRLSSPAPPDGIPQQDKDLKTPLEEGKEREKPGKSTKTDTAVDEPSETVKQTKSPELNVKKEVVQSEKKSESDSDKPEVDNGDVTRKEVQKESVKAEEDALPELVTEAEKSRDNAVSEAQEETTSADDK